MAVHRRANLNLVVKLGGNLPLWRDFCAWMGVVDIIDARSPLAVQAELSGGTVVDEMKRQEAPQWDGRQEMSSKSENHVFEKIASRRLTVACAAAKRVHAPGCTETRRASDERRIA
ncbi:MAG TPA: hypothetical protein VNP04_24440 [Alphaproteobacteria bacterium]|nr:hypothetical protein [Alphaproteobacteria bacterium]